MELENIENIESVESDLMPEWAETPYDVTNETTEYTLIDLPAGTVRVDYSVDLGDLLNALLLFSILATYIFRYVSDALRERRAD